MVAAGLRALFHVYASSLRRHPWRTQVVTTGALWCCGDLLAQRLEARASGRAAVWDARRTALTAGYGGLFIGPLGHAWYLGLDVAARRLLSPGTAGFIAGKVLADTFLFGPVYTLGFFATVALGEGGGWEGVRAKVAQDFAPAFLAEVAVWPAVQTLNFRLVPVEYQLLVVNAVTVLDAAFMSYAGNNDVSGTIAAAVPALAPLLGRTPGGGEEGQQRREGRRPSGGERPGATRGKGAACTGADAR